MKTLYFSIIIGSIIGVSIFIIIFMMNENQKQDISSCQTLPNGTMSCFYPDQVNILNLQGMYKVGDPITFVVRPYYVVTQKGYSMPLSDVPKVSIENINHTTILSNLQQVNVGWPGMSAGNGQFLYYLTYSNEGKSIVNNPGTYFLLVSFENKTIDREFNVY